MSSSTPPIPPAPPPKPTSRTSTPQTTTTHRHPPPPAAPQQPFIPPNLHQYSVGDLQYLAHSPALLNALFTSSHPTSHSANAALTAALTSNITTAQRLSTLEASLAAQRQTAQQKLVAARALERKWREREQEMYVALQRFSSPVMYARLAAGVEEAEAETEELEASLVDGAVGEAGLEVWVRAYRDGRKKVGLRRERVGRWEEGRVGGWR